MVDRGSLSAEISTAEGGARVSPQQARVRFEREQHKLITCQVCVLLLSRVG